MFEVVRDVEMWNGEDVKGIVLNMYGQLTGLI